MYLYRFTCSQNVVRLERKNPTKVWNTAAVPEKERDDLLGSHGDGRREGAEAPVPLVAPFVLS